MSTLQGPCFQLAIYCSLPLFLELSSLQQEHKATRRKNESHTELTAIIAGYSSYSAASSTQN